MKHKKIAILQSNYIPWKGYFDLINSVDEFVIYDDMQFTKNDWRNRNRIKTSNGSQWLTIPVRHETLTQKISETLTANTLWPTKHWKTIRQNYAKTPYFPDYAPLFEELYLTAATQERRLSKINYMFLKTLCNILGIKTKLRWSEEFSLSGDRMQRLIGICKESGADGYVSGPAARNYFDLALARDEGIDVEWMDYSQYPEYPQCNPPFDHFVSILDLLFNTGPDTKSYMKTFHAAK